MTTRMAVFFVVVPVLWVVLHVYMGRRLLRDSGLSWLGRRAAWAALTVMAGLPTFTFLVLRGGGDAPPGIQWLGYLLMGLSSIALVLLVTVDLLRLGRGLFVRWRRSGSESDSGPEPGRRAFLGRAVNLGIAGGAGSVTGIGAVQAAQMPQLVEVDVPLEGLPPEAEGFRIVQISDVHVGPTIHGDFLAAVVERINALNPDLVAVTGDLIDGYVEDLRDQVASLSSIESRHGTFFVTGNHEYYWNGPAWCDEMRRLGLVVLDNQHRVIEHDGARLLLAGVNDYSAGGMVPSHASDPAAACADAPECGVKLLLAHQPRSIYAAAEAGYDLQISGHTHGGQYFPMNMLVYLAQPYVAGLERHGNTWIYVSRGTGYWGPPVRMGAPHEITVLRLVSA